MPDGTTDFNKYDYTVLPSDVWNGIPTVYNASGEQLSESEVFEYLSNVNEEGYTFKDGGYDVSSNARVITAFDSEGNRLSENQLAEYMKPSIEGYEVGYSPFNDNYTIWDSDGKQVKHFTNNILGNNYKLAGRPVKTFNGLLVDNLGQVVPHDEVATYVQSGVNDPNSSSYIPFGDELNNYYGLGFKKEGTLVSDMFQNGGIGQGQAGNVNQGQTGGVGQGGIGAGVISDFLTSGNPLLGSPQVNRTPVGQAALLQEDMLRRSLPVAQEGFAGARGDIQAGFDEASQALAPFLQAGEQAAGQVDLLLDPQAQFNYLQSNPLYQAALENANLQTQSGAAARGRLAAGDTLQALSQNTLLAAQPLLTQQQSNIQNLLGLGAGVAGTQASLSADKGDRLAGLATGEAESLIDLLSQIGNTRAAGLIGFDNMRNAEEDRDAKTQNAIIKGLTAILSQG